MAKKNPLIRSYPRKVNKPQPKKSAGILDDFAVRKNIATSEGTIEKVPVDNSDIVNKAYADSLVPVTHASTTGQTTDDHHTESHNIASHSDTSATGGELNTLTDNSMADTLHRHSELSASDGTPDAALQVDAAGNVDVDGIISVIEDSSNFLQVGRFSAGGNMGIISSTPVAAGMTFHTGGEERIRIEPAGDVGIGTNNPTTPLDVKSSADNILGGIRLTDLDTSGYPVLIHQNANRGLITLHNSNVAKINLNAGGDSYFLNDVGIGTTSPAAKLDVNGIATFAGRIAADGGMTMGQSIVMSDKFLYLTAAGESISGVGASGAINMLARGAITTTFNANNIGTDYNIIEDDTSAFFIEGGTRNVGIGTATPAAKTHIDQSSTTAAIPVLTLDQADISEEMIEFVTTIGTGNPIEAVAAKTLTTTHFIKVTIPGGLTRYIPCGTIA